ncbi:nucleotide exchange factor GrpE [Aliikangiella sp. IMCC44359]|uniref:nucleotide exchange factor GrpE n=1 Tax=Aliikangiella sp. IMCC44359 TaxID=3459125 RepID=UPI00403AB7C9
MSDNEDLQSAEENQEVAPEEQKLTFEEQVETLTAELNKALEEAETHKDVAVRAKAESENIRRRAEREVSNASKFALERFAKEILAVVDSLEKALEHPVEGEAQTSMKEGIELTYKLLIDTLNKFSIEQIDPLGDAFDPGLHEAMVMQESAEHEPNSVMNVIQMGYSLNGRLIRPARVIVAKGKSPEIDEKA